VGGCDVGCVQPRAGSGRTACTIPGGARPQDAAGLGTVLPSRAARPWRAQEPAADGGARLELAGHDQLQHFIASTAWDHSAVWTVLAHEADRLVGEWRTSGERKFTLSSLEPRTSLRALAAAIKARRVCEQGHQQLKGELGLGHFEGRSWTGLHRHALMTCIACAYLQHLGLAEHRRAGRGKNADLAAGSTAAAQPACHAPRHRSPAVRAPRKTCPMSASQAPVPTIA
jgi:hypothetical protein